jgi:hypothetical protein
MPAAEDIAAAAGVRAGVDGPGVADPLVDDFEALVAVLDPDVVARSRGRAAAFELRGAENVARAAMTARRFAPFVRPALINGTAGAVAFDGDTPFAILAFTVVAGRAVTIDIFNDRELVPRLVRSGEVANLLSVSED